MLIQLSGLPGSSFTASFSFSIASISGRGDCLLLAVLRGGFVSGAVGWDKAGDALPPDVFGVLGLAGGTAMVGGGQQRFAVGGQQPADCLLCRRPEGSLGFVEAVAIKGFALFRRQIPLMAGGGRC